MITFNEARSNYYQMGWSVEQAARACGMSESSFKLNLRTITQCANSKIAKMLDTAVVFIKNG